MTFIERISTDIANAMRAKDAMRLGALRMAKAALMNQEVQKGRPLEEAESQQVMTSLIKQRRDSIEQFRKGGRDDLADKEAAEITTLEAYLPAPIDAAGLERIVDEVVDRARRERPEGSRQGDEGRHAQAGGTGGGRQAGHRARKAPPGMRMPQTFPVSRRLNRLKGSHKPLIHPPSGFCRKAEASFCTQRVISDTRAAQIVRIRTALVYAHQLMRALNCRFTAPSPNR